VGTIALLLAAFILVWLVPRGPEIGNATGTDTGTGTGLTAGGPQADAPASKTQYQPIGAPSMATISDQPHISVSGQGIVSARPDMVELQVGVQIQRDSLDAAQAEAVDKMNAVINQLKASGVAENDISTAQYSVEPVMDYRDNQSPRLIGFRVTNIVNAKLRDISKAGKTVDDVVRSGANTVYGLRFSFSDPTALTKQARERAMQDAKAKAEQLAGLSGVSLGAPIMISEGVVNVPPPVMELDARAAQGASGVPTPIQPGNQEIRVDVQVVYAIK
jgi:uncharacterized protein YggE